MRVNVRVKILYLPHKGEVVLDIPDGLTQDEIEVEIANAVVPNILEIRYEVIVPPALKKE